MSASTEPGIAPAEPDARYQRTLLLVVMLAVMGFGSLMTIVTVSLDDIADDLGSSRATLTWVITGLMLTMAVATPITGKLGDIRGHRRLFLLGLGGSAVTTALCATAWDAGSLIAFRVLFGLTGAMMMPSGMALMMHAYGPERRATGMGWYQFAMTGAPTIGLVLGGPLIEVIGWRAIFGVFAAVAVGALLVGIALVRPIPRQHGSSLDVAGAFTLGVGVLAGLLAITRATTLLRERGWVDAVTDPVALGLLIACVAGMAAFVQVERRADAPMIRLDYFGRRNFSLPMIATALLQFAYMGGFVVIPALLGQPYGWTVAAIALLLAPRPAAFSLAAPIGGYLAARIGEKKPIVLGLGCMVASMAAFAAASAMVSGLGIGLVLIGLVLSGASAGISQPAVASMVVGAVDPADMGIANGMSQQTMFIGMVTGIQSMNVLVGDEASTGQFVATFAFGLVVAVFGLLAALAIEDRSAVAPTGG